MDYYPLILGDDKPLQASLFPIHQHVQVPNMEESSPMFQPYGYGLCREIPTPENSLKKGTAKHLHMRPMPLLHSAGSTQVAAMGASFSVTQVRKCDMCDISLPVGLMWMQIRNTCGGYL